MHANTHTQTQLVKALKREMIQHRRCIQNSLADRLVSDVRRYKTIDDHFAAKKGVIVRTAEHTKDVLDRKHQFYSGRGELAIDMVFGDMDSKLRKLQRDMNREFESLKRENRACMDTIDAMHHKMAVQRSTCHFFKALYETEPSRPIGESIEMLREN